MIVLRACIRPPTHRTQELCHWGQYMSVLAHSDRGSHPHNTAPPVCRTRAGKSPIYTPSPNVDRIELLPHQRNTAGQSHDHRGHRYPSQDRTEDRHCMCCRDDIALPRRHGEARCTSHVLPAPDHCKKDRHCSRCLLQNGCCSTPHFHCRTRGIWIREARPRAEQRVGREHTRNCSGHYTDRQHNIADLPYRRKQVQEEVAWAEEGHGMPPSGIPFRDYRYRHHPRDW